MKRKTRARLSSTGENLDDLRSRIRDVTRTIFSLVKARQSLSEKIALIKKENGLAVDDRRVEARLVESMENYANSLRLDGKFARHITKDLIEVSKSVQRRAIFSDEIKANLRSEGIRRVGIIGVGRMGSWFASYFRPLAKTVMLYDSNKKLAKKRSKDLRCGYCKSLQDIVTCDLIFTCIPVEETIKVTKRLLSLVKENESKTRIFEISSVKEKVIRELKGSKNLYSIHPLFGFSADAFGENLLIVVEARRREIEFVELLFPHFRILRMNAREHDMLMARLLSLPHVLAMSFARIASDTKLPKDVVSPSYDTLLQIARKTLSENPKIYYEIQALNKYNKKMRTKIRDSVRKLEILSGGDYPSFERFFSSTRKKLT